MFNNVLKSAPLIRRLEQADKIEFLETEQQTKNIINQLKQHSQAKSQSTITHSKQLCYQQKKFAIMGSKISEATDSTDSLGMTDPHKYEASERIGKLLMARNVPYKATDILSQILQKNLNNYNHLINYNYRIRNHEDELKTNRLNFLYGMRHTEQTFSVRPASLNDLNERLSRIYTIKSSSGNREPDQKDSSTQTRIVYNLSKKQTGNGSGSAVAAHSKSHKNQFDSASMESLELPTYNKLGLVEFNDFQSHHWHCTTHSILIELEPIFIHLYHNLPLFYYHIYNRNSQWSFLQI